jgi:hypothetical protein
MTNLTPSTSQCSTEFRVNRRDMNMMSIMLGYRVRTLDRPN